MNLQAQPFEHEQLQENEILVSPYTYHYLKTLESHQCKATKEWLEFYYEQTRIWIRAQNDSHPGGAYDSSIGIARLDEALKVQEIEFCENRGHLMLLATEKTEKIPAMCNGTITPSPTHGGVLMTCKSPLKMKILDPVMFDSCTANTTCILTNGKEIEVISPAP